MHDFEILTKSTMTLTPYQKSNICHLKSNTFTYVKLKSGQNLKDVRDALYYVGRRENKKFSVSRRTDVGRRMELIVTRM